MEQSSFLSELSRARFELKRLLMCPHEDSPSISSDVWVVTGALMEPNVSSSLLAPLSSWKTAATWNAQLSLVGIYSLVSRAVVGQSVLDAWWTESEEKLA